MFQYLGKLSAALGLWLIMANSAFADKLPVASNQIVVKESGTLIFMHKNYDFQDVNPIYNDHGQVVGLSSEYLPAKQNFDSWKNMITIQAFKGNKTMDSSEFAWALYDVVKNKPATMVESPIASSDTGAVYLVEYQAAILSSGDGSVAVSGKQTTATANLAKTASNKVMERSIHKIYIDKKSGNLINLIYGERKYGKVTKTQLQQWDQQNPDIMTQLEHLTPEVGNVDKAPSISN